MLWHRVRATVIDHNLVSRAFAGEQHARLAYLACRPTAPDRRRCCRLVFQQRRDQFHGHSDDGRNASAGGFRDPARVLAKPVRILPISLENPLMRTCADDACCEAIHDAVNDKLPPWTKNYDRGPSTPTMLPVAMARRSNARRLCRPRGQRAGAGLRCDRGVELSSFVRSSLLRFERMESIVHAVWRRSYTDSGTEICRKAAQTGTLRETDEDFPAWRGSLARSGGSPR
jgi:hypothetical protein